MLSKNVIIGLIGLALGVAGIFATFWVGGEPSADRVSISQEAQDEGNNQINYAEGDINIVQMDEGPPYSQAYLDAVKVVQDIVSDNARSMRYHDNRTLVVDECVVRQTGYDWVTADWEAGQDGLMLTYEFPADSISPTSIGLSPDWSPDEGNWPRMLLKLPADAVRTYNDGRLIRTEDTAYMEFQSEEQLEKFRQSLLTIVGECMSRKRF